MIFDAIRQMTQALENLGRFLDKGLELAEAKSFAPENLLDARLAPDMFPLTRQVQSAADSAKFAAARLAGKEAPSDPDDETTMDALKARIAKTVAYLSTFSAADFEGAEGREIQLSFVPLPATGKNYLLQFAQPNFYFHLTTAYAILRHNGVELGKRDFIGRFDLIKG